MTVEALSTHDILNRIRYDPLTKKGSVLDVIQLVTGCGQNNAAKVLRRLQVQYEDLLSAVEMHKFPGQGQRDTTVASLPTLLHIMAIAPGAKARKFNRATMDVFCRALGADTSLAREIMDRNTQLQGTPYENMADWVTTTVDDAMEVLQQPFEPPCDEGCVYVATSPLLSAFKLGYWTGSLDNLRARYMTCYGPSLDLRTWPCIQCRACEASMLKEFASFSVGGELFDKLCLPDVIELLDTAARM